MKSGFNLRINGTPYYVRCESEIQRNYNGNYGLHLEFIVRDLSTNRLISGKELRGTYVEEKISDYIKNSINGQRTCYYQWGGDNENGYVCYTKEEWEENRGKIGVE